MRGSQMKEDINAQTLATITNQYFGGNEVTMRQWMAQKNPALEGQAPISVIAQPTGYIAVRAAAALTAPAPAGQ